MRFKYAIFFYDDCDCEPPDAAQGWEPLHMAASAVGEEGVLDTVRVAVLWRRPLTMAERRAEQLEESTDWEDLHARGGA